eukprot:1985375-Prymnesium_polylepis.2
MSAHPPVSQQSCSGMSVRELLDIVAERDFRQFSPERFPFDYSRAKARARELASAPIPQEARNLQQAIDEARQDIATRLEASHAHTLLVVSDSDDDALQSAPKDKLRDIIEQQLSSGWLLVNASFISTTPAHMLTHFKGSFVACRVCRRLVAAPSVIKRNSHHLFCSCFSMVICGDEACKAALNKVHECKSKLNKAFELTRLVFSDNEDRIGPFVVTFDSTDVYDDSAPHTTRVIPITTALSLGHLIRTDLACRILKHPIGHDMLSFMQSHSGSLLYAAVQAYSSARSDRVCRVCQKVAKDGKRPSKAQKENESDWLIAAVKRRSQQQQLSEPRG